MAKKNKKSDDVVWSVTSTKADGITLHFGPELSDAPYSDEAKLQILGKALIGLGTRLMGSTTSNDEDFDDEWED